MSAPTPARRGSRALAQLAAREPRLGSPFAQAVVPVVVGIVFLAVLGGLLWGVSFVLSRGSESGAVEQRISDTQFDLGKAESRAESVRRFGPFAFQDPLVTDRRPVFVNHIGTDPYTGWVAIEALDPVTRCVLDWNPTTQRFVDRRCSGKDYPGTGDGLNRFDALANRESGRLIVDLSAPTG
jgi:hypothetical protein